MKKIKICGVGSVLLGDDAVGPYTARWIAANYEFGEGVEMTRQKSPASGPLFALIRIYPALLNQSLSPNLPAKALKRFISSE